MTTQAATLPVFSAPSAARARKVAGKPAAAVLPVAGLPAAVLANMTPRAQRLMRVGY